jgi:hypothetical protein
MQIDIPHNVYGRCDWFVPAPIALWLSKQGLGLSLCGKTSDGTGKAVSHYIVDGASVDDALSFKLRFPDCKVRHSVL